MSTGPTRQPLHRIIDLLTAGPTARRFHQAGTMHAARIARGVAACHHAVWEGSPSRNDAIRRLADPASRPG